jgi:hypothetical protein
VRVTAARRGDISEVLSVTGETAALSMLRLASPVAGRVTLLNVRPGDQLAAREVAARVMPIENEAALHGFTLLQGATGLSAEDQATARRLQRDLGTRDVPLRAPFPSVVAERLHNPGEQVAQNEVVLLLFDPRSLYVLAQVPVEAATRITAGMPVEVQSAGQQAAGTVAALITTLAPETLTAPVRISLTTPLQLPLLHATAECRITMRRHSNALLIPRSALLSSAVGDQGTVMVSTGGRAQRRRVQLGLRTQQEVEITGGLADAESVLVNGYSLPDGTAIQPLPISE